ncbi:hypothetical protein TNCV_164861 [Trichonephila clavipes]|nr:hypothetical protein TNCV_164861 [Trichonephila clavipes]
MDSDSWSACHEFEPIIHHVDKLILVKPFEYQSSPDDVVWEFGGVPSQDLGSKQIKSAAVAQWSRYRLMAGEELPAQVSSSSLDHGSKLRGASPKALV